MALLIIDHCKLARCDSLHVLFAINDPLSVTDAGESATHYVRGMAVLEHDVNGAVHTFPWIARDEVHLVEPQGAAILLGCAVTVRDINDVLVHVLAHHIPWSSTQSQAFTLANRVEPIAAVLTQLATRFQLNDGTGAFAQMAADEIVVVDLAQEADALAVSTMGIGQVGILGNAAHLVLGQRADGEHDMLQLLVGNLRQEIGLVLDRVNRRGQIFHTIYNLGSRIMPSCGHVKVLTPPLLKKTELDHAVAHHVGVGRETCLDGAQGVFHHMIPVLLMQRHHLKRQAVAMCDEGTHLDIFLGTAVTLIIIHANADVKQVQVLATLLKLVNDDRAVNTS